MSVYKLPSYTFFRESTALSYSCLPIAASVCHCSDSENTEFEYFQVRVLRARQQPPTTDTREAEAGQRYTCRQGRAGQND